MTLCAGVCSYDRAGFCSVRLSVPLLRLRPRADLVNTLLHEMIHGQCVLMADHLFPCSFARDHNAPPRFSLHPASSSTEYTQPTSLSLGRTKTEMVTDQAFWNRWR